jgi:hypothetical protein
MVLFVGVAAGCKGGGSTAQHDGEGEAGTFGGAGSGGSAACGAAASAAPRA